MDTDHRLLFDLPTIGLSVDQDIANFSELCLLGAKVVNYRPTIRAVDQTMFR